MKRTLFLTLSLSLCLLPSCQRNSREMWEDSKTCGRYMGKGFRSLFGRHDDSHEFAYGGNDFIPLSDQEYDGQFAMHEYALSKESPGDPGSSLPGIDGFRDPTGAIARVFGNVHFDTDNYTVKGADNLQRLQDIANYLIKHPKTYIFVEGHADERGAAAYNLALGSRRANSVRTFLIEQGVCHDQIFTISYGKERPIAQGHDQNAWKLNRRGQFKIYQK